MIKYLVTVDSSMLYAVGYDEDKEVMEAVYLKGRSLSAPKSD